MKRAEFICILIGLAVVIELLISVLIIVSNSEIELRDSLVLVQIFATGAFSILTIAVAKGTQKIFRENKLRDDRKHATDMITLWKSANDWMIDKSLIKKALELKRWQLKNVTTTGINEQKLALAELQVLSLETKSLIEILVVNKHCANDSSAELFKSHTLAKIETPQIEELTALIKTMIITTTETTEKLSTSNESSYLNELCSSLNDEFNETLIKSLELNQILTGIYNHYPSVVSKGITEKTH